MLYGAELQSVTQNQLSELRRSVTAMVWRGKTCTRGPVATHSRSHSLDSASTLNNRSYTTPSSLNKRRVGTARLLGNCFGAWKTSQKGSGPVAVLAKAAKQLGWS